MKKIEEDYFTAKNFVCCLIILLAIPLEYILIQPNRGQAMAIPMGFFIDLPLIVSFIAFIFIDFKEKKNSARYFTIVANAIFSIYLVSKMIFYYRPEHDIGFYEENFYDLFPPPKEDLYLIIFFSSRLVIYSIYRILFFKKLNFKIHKD